MNNSSHARLGRSTDCGELAVSFFDDRGEDLNAGRIEHAARTGERPSGAALASEVSDQFATTAAALQRL